MSDFLEELLRGTEIDRSKLSSPLSLTRYGQVRLANRLCER